MENREIEEKIIKLKAQLASINVQIGAIGLAGGIGGVMIRKRNTFLGKASSFLIGSIISGIATNLIYANKVSEIVAEIVILEEQLK